MTVAATTVGLPYYRDVPNLVAGAVSVGRDIMPDTTVGTTRKRRWVAIVTRESCERLSAAHAIHLSYRQ